ncbi:MAG TPA: three-Cys-motif partner protein TcmP [Chthoniobacteraceae bacterium]|nr:three-Cys-motif partner protein TcmP [Chthoniobacteraceae bacterium]
MEPATFHSCEYSKATVRRRLDGGEVGTSSKISVAYAKIMRGQDFRFAYIDAFAGTGYNSPRAKKEPVASLFPELAEDEAASFIDGSARIALRVDPRFTKYIFIEKDPKRFDELGKLKKEFPALASDIVLINADANAYLRDICENRKWSRNRAVLFLDPFGMQVTWETMKAISKTKAIDLWILFPLGIGVNRLLRRDAKIPEAWQRRLDDFFGTAEWQAAFYETTTVEDLFGDQAMTKQVANFDSIGVFFVDRLITIFPGVAKNPLALHNSANTPLYLLCFAAANERGAKTAVKIAQDILKP